MTELNDTAKWVAAATDPNALGLIHRVRPSRLPATEQPPVLIMLHGYEGTEDVTWIFARAADPDWLIIAPRAIHASTTGYSWFTLDPETRAATPDSVAASQVAFGRFLDQAVTHYGGDPGRVVLLGFSQGAAMSLIYGATHPDTIRGVVSLGGFIPKLGDLAIPPLNNLPVLILHGTLDETIPVKYAERVRDRLTEAGAAVTFETSEIGHKVSAQGMRTLTTWLAARK